ncbi:MAG: tRNA (adenosine(37)-N6)-threonylcarbamoyltransferase complex ATPase subunit type 1 TsaE [Candidatus Aureabacteria bacterium]|nr:tRNA (adenosine(37)-N6)-threonylcarbamoyltransferase complex ATPase subunit type 1 TsaE [Candidatus Auribacterota bacterium]
MGQHDLVVTSSSPEETRALGEKIGSRLRAGAVVALFGELGSGKTCLVQGVASGLGVDPSVTVNSPSYVLINEYPGRIPLFHFDFYRVHDWREVYDLGWDDYLDKGGVIAIEWAERMNNLLPEEHIRIDLQITGENSRSIRISGDDIADQVCRQ